MAADHSNVVRASEIAAYCFCHRAWSYQRQGIPADNLVNLTEGNQYHHRHGRTILTIRLARLAAIILIVIAIALVLVR